MQNCSTENVCQKIYPKQLSQLKVPHKDIIDIVVNSIVTCTVDPSSADAVSYLLQCYLTKAAAKVGTLPPTGLTVFQAQTKVSSRLMPQPQKFAFNFTLNIFSARLAIHISRVSVVKSLWSLKVFCLLSS